MGIWSWKRLRPKQITSTRDYDPDEPRDWSGHWISQALESAGKGASTTVSLEQLENDRAVYNAVVKGMSDYMEWIVQQELPNVWVRSIPTVMDRRQAATEWVNAAIQSLRQSDQDALELDNKWA